MHCLRSYHLRVWCWLRGLLSSLALVCVCVCVSVCCVRFTCVASFTIHITQPNTASESDTSSEVSSAVRMLAVGAALFQAFIGSVVSILVRTLQGLSLCALLPVVFLYVCVCAYVCFLQAWMQWSSSTIFRF